ncbi:MAG: class I SAM-dependent methyltransferase [Candidatus Omnitrophota bacterium]|nr:class I SAM-dependent methyltransferase [Candidatus Omnitrophota bacterium]
MIKFGRWQRFASDELRSLGKIGLIYSKIVGFTQPPLFGYSLWFRKIIDKFNIEFMRVLDAGCGLGEYAFYIAEKYPYSYVTGVDINECKIKKCLYVKKFSKLTNIDFKMLDLRQLEVKEEHDFICANDVLEHIKENKQVLYNFYRALRPGGWLYIRIPIAIQKRIFKEKYLKSYNQWAKNEHVGQHYNYVSLSNDLQEIGFSIVFFSYTDGFWGRLAFELTHIIKEKNKLLYAIFVPFLKTLVRLDSLNINKKIGDGLVFLACKESCSSYKYD